MATATSASDMTWSACHRWRSTVIGGCTKYMISVLHPWCICACIRIHYITSVQKWNTHIITCRTRRQFHTQTPLQMQCYKCNVTSALQNQEALCEPSESTVSTNEKETLSTSLGGNCGTVLKMSLFELIGAARSSASDLP